MGCPVEFSAAQHSTVLPRVIILLRLSASQVKFLKSGAIPLQDLEREAELLSRMSHPNIIRMFGVTYSLSGTLESIICEYMVHGDLLSFLKIHRPDESYLTPREFDSCCYHGEDDVNKYFFGTYECGDGALFEGSVGAEGGETDREPVGGATRLVSGTSAVKPVKDLRTLSLEDLLDIAIQVTQGLQYLSEQHFVHRDLAARNCLVGSDMVIKLSDFGLSRDVYSSDYYKVSGNAGAVPVRWMSPEAVQFRLFTPQSDIWSLGVVFWEIFSYGQHPWFGYSNEQVLRFLTNHQVLRCPEGCPRRVYTLMEACWKIRPENRITVDKILEALHDIRHQAATYLEIQSSEYSIQFLPSIAFYKPEARSSGLEKKSYSRTWGDTFPRGLEYILSSYRWKGTKAVQVMSYTMSSSPRPGLRKGESFDLSLLQILSWTKVICCKPVAKHGGEKVQTEKKV
ncbi:unnamed protein product [Notodromas monacha]|uniref:Protein kinase domain-containing protein n=1 Tax=Notodromas monacha TaxID=399045 RepID=A0A7R9G7Q5_9CRUS|nr:unnamed protein product [Notodromas monacha]CAG0912500.1 unnamed protein product [Notodromas monacha]